MSYGEDLSARPVGVPQPDRDYQPPRPAYRRPGSDHSHIGSKETKQMAPAQPAPGARRTPDSKETPKGVPTVRREITLLLIKQGPMRKADLAAALPSLDDKQLTKHLHALKKRGSIMQDKWGAPYYVPSNPPEQSAPSASDAKPYVPENQLQHARDQREAGRIKRLERKLAEAQEDKATKPDPVDQILRANEERARESLTLYIQRMNDPVLEQLLEGMAIAQEARAAHSKRKAS